MKVIKIENEFHDLDKERIQFIIEVNDCYCKYPEKTPAWWNKKEGDSKKKPPNFTGMVSEQEYSDIVIFKADIVKSNLFLVSTNLVADSGAFTNNVHSSFS